jgi:hypothetical protein
MVSQIDAIKPIYQMREYDDPDQRNSNVLSYKRSMSVSLFVAEFEMVNGMLIPDVDLEV